MISRRCFLRTLGLLTGGTAGVGLYAWRVEPHWLQLTFRLLPIRNLPDALVNKTLVQLSDIHLGTRVDDDYVLETFRRIARLDADIIVLTGDFISYHDQIWPQMSRIYREFPRGRLATLAILGNHDYGYFWSHPEVAEQVVEIASECGIAVLRNEIRSVEGLQIVGLDDLWGGRFPGAPGTIAQILRSQPALVLSHNPDTVDFPIWSGYNGWILSGHTHGGQCKPPFLPPPLLPVQNRRYTAGEFDLDGDRKMYISRGVGHLLHVRFNVRPEVTVFTLARA